MARYRASTTALLASHSSSQTAATVIHTSIHTRPSSRVTAPAWGALAVLYSSCRHSCLYPAVMRLWGEGQWGEKGVTGGRLARGTLLSLMLLHIIQRGVAKLSPELV